MCFCAKVGQHKESSATHTSPYSSKFHNTSLVEVTNKVRPIFHSELLRGKPRHTIHVQCIFKNLNMLQATRYKIASLADHKSVTDTLHPVLPPTLKSELVIKLKWENTNNFRLKLKY